MEDLYIDVVDDNFFLQLLDLYTQNQNLLDTTDHRSILAYTLIGEYHITIPITFWQAFIRNFENEVAAKRFLKSFAEIKLQVRDELEKRPYANLYIDRILLTIDPETPDNLLLQMLLPVQRFRSCDFLLASFVNDSVTIGLAELLERDRIGNDNEALDYLLENQSNLIERLKKEFRISPLLINDDLYLLSSTALTLPEIRRFYLELHENLRKLFMDIFSLKEEPLYVLNSLALRPYLLTQYSLQLYNRFEIAFDDGQVVSTLKWFLQILPEIRATILYPKEGGNDYNREIDEMVWNFLKRVATSPEVRLEQVTNYISFDLFTHDYKLVTLRAVKLEAPVPNSHFEKILATSEISLAAYKLYTILVPKPILQVSAYKTTAGFDVSTLIQ